MSSESQGVLRSAGESAAKACIVCLLVGLSASSFGCEKASSTGKNLPESSAGKRATAPVEGETVAHPSGTPGEEPASYTLEAKPTASAPRAPGDNVPKSTDTPEQDDAPVAAPAPEAIASRAAASASASSPAQKDDERRPANTFAPLGAGSPAATECVSDSDCSVSCYFDGRCCQELCGCSQVYNRAFAARLAQAVAQNCSPDVRCPVARCIGTKGGRAVCEQGSCVLARSEGKVAVPPNVSSP